MEAVKRGGDRQELHEVIRRCSMEATVRMKEGESCDLLERLAAEPAFQLNGQDLEELLKPEDYIGRCPEQVDAFVEKITPLFKDLKQEKTEINV